MVDIKRVAGGIEVSASDVENSVTNLYYNQGSSSQPRNIFTDMVDFLNEGAQIFGRQYLILVTDATISSKAITREYSTEWSAFAASYPVYAAQYYGAIIISTQDFDGEKVTIDTNHDRIINSSDDARFVTFEDIVTHEISHLAQDLLTGRKMDFANQSAREYGAVSASDSILYDNFQLDPRLQYSSFDSALSGLTPPFYNAAPAANPIPNSPIETAITLENFNRLINVLNVGQEVPPSSTSATPHVQSLPAYLVGGVEVEGAFGDWFEPLRGWSDPLAVDLDGTGDIETLPADSVYFDIDADGMAEAVSWISSGDGWLAIDSNENGKIDGVGELFGSDGTGGFAALAALDTNADGKIDAQDAAYSQLVVWQDKNSDGVSQAGELLSIADDLFIREVSLTHVNGVGTAEAAIGQLHVEDMVLAVDNRNAVSTGETILDLDVLFLSVVANDNNIFATQPRYMTRAA